MLHFFFSFFFAFSIFVKYLAGDNLIFSFFLSALRGGIDEDKRRDLVKKLLKVLKSGNVECPICLNDWKSPVITPCKHVFCRQFILDVLNVAPQV